MNQPGAGRLRTVSLSRRVVVLSLGVLAMVLLLVSLLAEVIVGAQARGELGDRLAGAAQLADQLAGQGADGERIVEQVRSQGVRVRVIRPDGAVHGDRWLRRYDERASGSSPRIDEPASGPSPRFDEHRPGPPRFGRRDDPAPAPPVLRRTLVDGSRLTVVGDADLVDGAQRRLRRVLMLLGLGGLAVAAVALLATTRVALRPLDSMTALARSIAAGDRGRRLAPTRRDTELGRTAAAFDDMLDALEGAERQARHAETLARTSEIRTRQFVADAAHELRTPITGLRAAAEASLSSRAAGEERDRLQLLLIREAGRAGQLVEDLLALAQIDAGLRLRRESVELVGLAEIEAERIRLLAPGRAVRVAGEPVTVDADPGRLAQVLANLLDNARRHTPEGGEITIEVSRVGGDRGPARVRVADTGPGVPPRDRERIFDRLVRLDDARSRVGGSDGGAGLGLAIARGIARAHGGDLRCVDDSVFELTVPNHPR